MPNQKKKHKIEEKIEYPNFDEFLNHPLTVREESWYGGVKDYVINKDFKMVPIENKENAKLTTDNKAKTTENYLPKRKKSVRFKEPEIAQQPQAQQNPTGTSVVKGFMFSSPIVQNNSKKAFPSQLEKCNATPIEKAKSKFKVGRISVESSRNSEFNEKTDSISAINETPEDLILSKPSFKIRQDNSDSADLFSTDSENKTASTTQSSLSLNNSSDTYNKTDEQIRAILTKQPVVQLTTLNLNEIRHHIRNEDKQKWIWNAKRRSRSVKTKQGLNDSFWAAFQVENSRDVLFKMCQNNQPVKFNTMFPVKDRNNIRKIGEGSFGEVFYMENSDGLKLAVKFIPVEGSIKYNGVDQPLYDEAVSEVIVAKQVTEFSNSSSFRTNRFCQLIQVGVCVGKFPAYLQKKWDSYNRTKTSENDNPKIFNNQQEWIVLFFKYAGCPLENFDLKNWGQVYSIIIQSIASLALAEKQVEFEHRDLHWGNILILENSGQYDICNIIYDGEAISCDHYGVQVTIIDYTFSRMEKNGNVVYVDLSSDKELFLGEGDYQFEIYRKMKTYNENNWKCFNPKSNIFWIDYLCNKLIEKVESFLDKDQLKFREEEKKFNLICKCILEYESCQDFMTYFLNCNDFKNQ